MTQGQLLIIDVLADVQDNPVKKVWVAARSKVFRHLQKSGVSFAHSPAQSLVWAVLPASGTTIPWVLRADDDLEYLLFVFVSSCPLTVNAR